jgi:hypothetical protein
MGEDTEEWRRTVRVTMCTMLQEAVGRVLIVLEERIDRVVRYLREGVRLWVGMPQGIWEERRGYEYSGPCGYFVKCQAAIKDPRILFSVPSKCDVGSVIGALLACLKLNTLIEPPHPHHLRGRRKSTSDLSRRFPFYCRRQPTLTHISKLMHAQKPGNASFPPITQKTSSRAPAWLGCRSTDRSI